MLKNNAKIAEEENQRFKTKLLNIAAYLAAAISIAFPMFRRF